MASSKALATTASLYTPQVDAETRRRIRLTLAAYAYELEDNPIMSDEEYDALSKEIDLSINTRRSDLDAFFRKHFDPSTGMWIRSHPELPRVKHLYKVLLWNRTHPPSAPN